jgi:hypothetical protein
MSIAGRAEARQCQPRVIWMLWVEWLRTTTRPLDQRKQSRLKNLAEAVTAHRRGASGAKSMVFQGNCYQQYVEKNVVLGDDLMMIGAELSSPLSVVADLRRRAKTTDGGIPRMVKWAALDSNQ